MQVLLYMLDKLRPRPILIPQNRGKKKKKKNQWRTV